MYVVEIGVYLFGVFGMGDCRGGVVVGDVEIQLLYGDGVGEGGEYCRDYCSILLFDFVEYVIGSQQCFVECNDDEQLVMFGQVFVFDGLFVGV